MDQKSLLARLQSIHNGVISSKQHNPHPTFKYPKLQITGVHTADVNTIQHTLRPPPPHTQRISMSAVTNLNNQNSN